MTAELRDPSERGAMEGVRGVSHSVRLNFFYTADVQSKAEFTVTGHCLSVKLCLTARPKNQPLLIS